jgi:predicted transcriptional regulator
MIVTVRLKDELVEEIDRVAAANGAAALAPVE